MSLRKGLLVDTCALIAYVHTPDPNHAAVRDYIAEANRQNVPLYVSALTVAEFSVKQPASDIDSSTFIVAGFEQPEAELAGHCEAFLQRDEGDDRVRLKVDMMLIAHAEKLGLAGILTADKKSLAKYCERLRDGGHVEIHTIVVSDSFDPAKVIDPASLSFLSPPDELRH